MGYDTVIEHNYLEGMREEYDIVTCMGVGVTKITGYSSDDRIY
jgi:hypothetical protein